MRRALLTVFLAAFLFSSCDQFQAAPHAYFDSLVTAQINSLSSAKAKISKVARIDDQRDESTFQPAPGVWQDELDLFRQLDAFEKPVYRNAYVVTDHIPDRKSNLMIRSYEAVTPVPVSLLRFYYHDQFKNLRKIEATYTEKNALFSTRRLLTMEFEDVGGKPVLANYSLEGTQKMIFSDSVRFSMRSGITW